MKTKLQIWVDDITAKKVKLTKPTPVRGIHPAVWAELKRAIRTGKILPAYDVEADNG